MLKNVCDRCGNPVDGEPNGDKEFDDLDIIEGGEIIVSMVDLCDSCKQELAKVISEFAHPTRIKETGVEHRAVDKTRHERKQYPDVETEDVPANAIRTRTEELPPEGGVTMMVPVTKRDFIPNPSAARSSFDD